MSLDDALAASAPPLARRTSELERELLAMVLEAELASSSRGRRRRRIGIAVGAVISIVPLTAAASAVGMLPPWAVPWTTDGGSTCRMAFNAAPVDENGMPLDAGTVADPATRRAVAEARRFLSSFDYESIDESGAIARFQEDQRAASGSQGDEPDEVQPLTGDDLALSAVYAEVRARLDAHLRAEGMATARVGTGQVGICE